MTTRAVLFDLGNTLVHYYTASEFSSVLQQSLDLCGAVPGVAGGPQHGRARLDRALALNHERSDHAVWPLAERLAELFDVRVDRCRRADVAAAFLDPIFSTARLDPEALPVLTALRGAGIRTAIVSNTPWGSPPSPWREELARAGLLDVVDAAVFCAEVGWRKPHRAPFDRALALLDVRPEEALFVGDDPRWDVAGARNAGIHPVLLAAETQPRADVTTIASLSALVPLILGGGALAGRE